MEGVIRGGPPSLPPIDVTGLSHTPANDVCAAQVSTGNVSVSLPADRLSVVVDAQPVDQRFKILEHRSRVELSLSCHELQCFTPRSTGTQPQNWTVRPHTHTHTHTHTQSGFVWHLLDYTQFVEMQFFINFSWWNFDENFVENYDEYFTKCIHISRHFLAPRTGPPGIPVLKTRYSPPPKKKFPKIPVR